MEIFKNKPYLSILFMLLLASCTPKTNSFSFNRRIPLCSNSLVDYFGVQVRLDNGGMYGEEPSSEVLDVVENIVAQTGLDKNFIVVRTNVSNAVAFKCGDRRIIAYDEDYLDGINEEANTDWAAMTVLAHEVGHHLQDHQLQGSKPVTELEADRFAGWVLFQIGASLEQAQIAYHTVDQQGSSTHPPRAERLEAVEEGWRRAKNNKDLLVDYENRDRIYKEWLVDILRFESNIATGGSFGVVGTTYHYGNSLYTGLHVGGALSLTNQDGESKGARDTSTDFFVDADIGAYYYTPSVMYKFGLVGGVLFGDVTTFLVTPTFRVDFPLAKEQVFALSLGYQLGYSGVFFTGTTVGLGLSWRVQE